MVAGRGGGPESVPPAACRGYSVIYISSAIPTPYGKRVKTGSFTLTERINTATATSGLFTGTIDLGAYVDVGDQQAVAIESVDFVVQAYETDNDVWSGDLVAHCASDVTFDMQTI